MPKRKHIKKSLKLSKLALATTSAIIASFPAVSATAEQESSQNTPEIIEVKGIRTSVIAGLDLKRNSTSIVDAVSAEDMGKFPDANLAEALQRIPDIAIDRDGGEGRKVTIRGLGPEFNSVLLNGRKLASSEATRAFSFDTIASELVSEMVVYKTQSASITEGGIGGTIDVRTAKPLNYDGLTINGSLQGSYEENSEKTNPQGSLLISNTFLDEKLGVLFGATYQKRSNRTYSTNTDSIRTEGVFTNQPTWAYTSMGYDPAYRPIELNRNVVDDERERLGLNSVLQFRPNDKLDITVDFLYSKFDVTTDEYSKSNWFWDVLAPAEIEPRSNTTLDENGVFTNLTHSLRGPNGSGATAYNQQKRYRTTDTKMAGINIDYQINDDLNLVVDAAWSTATDDNKGRNRLRSTEVFADNATYGDTFDVDLSQSVPYVDNIEFFSAHNPTMAQDLLLRRHYNYGEDIEAENRQFKADLEIGSFQDLVITTGFSYEFAKKSFDDYRTNNAIQTLYHSNDGSFPEGEYDKVLSKILKVDSTKLGQPSSIDNDILVFDMDAFDALINNPEYALAAVGGDTSNSSYQAFIANNNSYDASRTGNSFEVEEQVTSLYLEGEYMFMLSDMEATVIGGVRYTKTDLDSVGYSQVLSDLTPIPCPGVEGRTCLEPTYADANGPDGLTKQKLSNSYSDILPSLTLNLNLTEDLILRLSSSKSLTRPFLEDMAPKFRVGTLSEDSRTAQTNNEKLAPYTSFNLDSSLEWYFSEGNMLSFSLFRKNISDFIIKETVAGVTVDSIANEEYQDFTVVRPTNGRNDVEITGATINLTQTFDSGFGYQFNYTKIDTDTEFNADTYDSTKAAVPGLGDSLNLVGFYESGPFSARIAYNKRDSFLRTSQYSSGFGWGEAFEEPAFADDYDQVDARISYDLSDSTTVFLEGVNLTGSTLSQHGRYDNIFISYENFGKRYVLGISSSF